MTSTFLFLVGAYSSSFVLLWQYLRYLNEKAQSIYYPHVADDEEDPHAGRPSNGARGKSNIPQRRALSQLDPIERAQFRRHLLKQAHHAGNRQSLVLPRWFSWLYVASFATREIVVHKAAHSWSIAVDASWRRFRDRREERTKSTSCGAMTNGVRTIPYGKATASRQYDVLLYSLLRGWIWVRPILRWLIWFCTVHGFMLHTLILFWLSHGSKDCWLGHSRDRRVSPSTYNDVKAHRITGAWTDNHTRTTPSLAYLCIVLFYSKSQIYTTFFIIFSFSHKCISTTEVGEASHPHSNPIESIKPTNTSNEAAHHQQNYPGNTKGENIQGPLLIISSVKLSR